MSASGASTNVRFEYGSDAQLTGATLTASRLLNPDATDVGVFVTVADCEHGARHTAFRYTVRCAEECRHDRVGAGIGSPRRGPKPALVCQ